MTRWTFLLWFELPSDLDAIDDGTPHLSSQARLELIEGALRGDGRWVLERTHLASPAGHDETQSLLFFVSAEAADPHDVEATVRAGVDQIVAAHVPGARLTWTIDVTTGST